jgi:hypothetical protein
MERKGSGLIWYSELQGGSRRLCRLRPTSIESEWTSIRNVLMHMGHMESPNRVASCVDELDDTLPRFMGVQWDSVRATHGLSGMTYTWKMTLGRGRTRPSFLAMSWIVWCPDFHKGINLKDLINYLNKQLFAAFMSMLTFFVLVSALILFYFILRVGIVRNLNLSSIQSNLQNRK